MKGVGKVLGALVAVSRGRYRIQAGPGTNQVKHSGVREGSRRD